MQLKTDNRDHFPQGALELTADIQSISVSYQQTDIQCIIWNPSSWKLHSLVRLWWPVTKQRSWVWIPQKSELVNKFSSSEDECRYLQNRIECSHGPFHSSLPLKRWKKLTSRTKSETQKDHLTVKTTEKKKQTYVLPLELGVVFQS